MSGADEMPLSIVGKTIQRDIPGSPGTSQGRPVDHLFLVLEGARPLSGGARWSLEGIDEVRIRRGSRRGSAREKDGPRTILSIKVPDPLLSSSHGRLVRGGSDSWTLVDDGSTNGTFASGTKVQVRPLTDGASFEMGAAHFVLRVGIPTPDDCRPDVESENLVSRTHGAASLLPAYAASLGDFARVALSGLSVLLLGESAVRAKRSSLPQRTSSRDERARSCRSTAARSPRH